MFQMSAKAMARREAQHMIGAREQVQEIEDDVKSLAKYCPKEEQYGVIPFGYKQVAQL